MAWLHAKPRPAPGTNQAHDPATALSRFEQAKRAGVTPRMPPLLMPHIVERLNEAGLVGSTGMSVTPLSWAEINEWARSAGFTVTSWEKRLIRALSVAYVAEGHRAEVDSCPPPWRGESIEAQRALEMAALDLLF